MEKISVGILGATGMVGQNYIKLLKDHPWFDVKYLAASPKSAGKKYFEAVTGRWVMDEEIPEGVRDTVVHDARDITRAKNECAFVFSSVEMDKQAIREIEDEYAAADIPVVSNNSAHRGTADVPVLIPEINPDHVDMIPIQQKNHGWKKGFVVVKPNCSLQSYMAPIDALRKAGFSVSRAIVTTLQAVSGAGYPGCASIDLIDNVIPFINGEEEKSEKEPLKIFGKIENRKFVDDDSIRISAHCNRVPVIDGHSACVSLEFADKRPSLSEIKAIWSQYRCEPQRLELPFAPHHPIVYRDEADRPQPRKDRNVEKGMAVTVGRLRECNVFDCRFVGLSHNTVRGAAGGGILNAELLKAKGYI
ncbi:MAG: aspartate-semialdehyde dehydrogenase [Deltaproteobacteria bacterium]|nr:aspartate-semialdehyde dehydrogenase [Deltaproteobacteria bacterium]